eukprot:CAMPEP_0117429326 /NCGR_PEP_ID=MMETSP0758-20121206/8887_1 /TAXON_ID=63605 /ORGANISM="Percolomonas cosmopolitus, Strain AE-1 (ATCC 50343)" /LENGTH=78 /DNA_ID=CAMNT_0005216277 /DNA_START=140 /DNA_END=373 /DNA_ORIENTATION=+
MESFNMNLQGGKNLVEELSNSYTQIPSKQFVQSSQVDSQPVYQQNTPYDPKRTVFVNVEKDGPIHYQYISKADDSVNQ